MNHSERGVPGVTEAPADRRSQRLAVCTHRNPLSVVKR